VSWDAVNTLAHELSHLVIGADREQMFQDEAEGAWRAQAGSYQLGNAFSSAGSARGRAQTRQRTRRACMKDVDDLGNTKRCSGVMVALPCVLHRSSCKHVPTRGDSEPFVYGYGGRRFFAKELNLPATGPRHAMSTTPSTHSRRHLRRNRSKSRAPALARGLLCSPSVSEQDHDEQSRAAEPFDDVAFAEQVATRPHDALFQRTFSDPVHAAGELRAVLPPELIEAIDFPSLRVLPRTMIDHTARCLRRPVRSAVPRAHRSWPLVGDVAVYLVRCRIGARAFS